MTDHQHRNISLWLLLICFVIFCMISLGGITRLTGSGLSMVEWAPITGILPPLNHTQWLAVFELYQASPEFVKVNHGLDLPGFKSIFWFEYFHRILGRLIGLLFFFPMLYFFIRYPLSATLRWKLFGLFMLGGAQGLMGWYMVKSGLVNDPHVSQYRLVAHLSLALILYIAIFWLGSGHFIRHFSQRYITPKFISKASLALFGLIFATILAGGFVAGTKAGFAFNTFPLMAGKLIPEGYGALTPWWRNLFENIAAVQFDHRLLASLSLLLTLGVCWAALRSAITPGLKKLYGVLLALVLIQYILGVVTLLSFVPLALGAAHQALAVLVMTASLLVLRVLTHLQEPLKNQ